MTVAPRSISEWPASDSIASEPAAKPTSALARVSPAEAKIEERATCSFSVCMRCPSSVDSSKFREQSGTRPSWRKWLSARRSRAGNRIENADIGEQLLEHETIGRAALDGVRCLEIHPHGIDML